MTANFAFDVFISYATDPDYVVARSLQRFLSSFHLLPWSRARHLSPLNVCLDGGSFLIRDNGRLLKTQETLDAHLALSRELLVLCSSGAVRSAQVAYEVNWFLEHREATAVAVHLAVTDGSAPDQDRAAVFPASVISAGLDQSIWYDLRELRGRRARKWQKVRDAGREQVRLVAELRAATGKTPRLTAEELYPDWLSYQLQERARKRRYNIAVAVTLVIAGLFAAAALQYSHMQSHLASLAERARQAVLVSEREPEKGLESVLQAWREFRSIEQSAWYGAIAKTAIVQTGARIHASFLSIASIRPGFAGVVTSSMDDPLLAASRDGTWLATAGARNHASQLEIWRAKGGQFESVAHSVFPERIQCLAMAPDGSQLVVGGRRYLTIFVREAGLRFQSNSIDLAAGEFSSLSCSSAAISVDGARAVLGTSDGQLFELALQSARLAEITVLHGEISNLVFTLDGHSLYAATWQQSAAIARITFAAGGTQATLLDDSSPPRTLAISDDGKTLYSGHEDGSIAAREVATGHLLWRTRVSEASVTEICVVPVGIVAGNESGELTVLALDPTGRPRSPQVVRVARSVISGLVPVLHTDRVAMASPGDPVRLWSADFAYPIEHVINTNTRGGGGIALAESGSVLTAFGDREVFRWQRSGELWQPVSSRVLNLPTGWSITSVDPNGQGVSLSAAYAEKTPDNFVHLSTAEGEPATLPGFETQLGRTAFSPGGTRLAVASFERPLRVAVWNLSEKLTTPTLFEPPGGTAATDVVFSRDAASLAVLDLKGCIYLWRLRQGAPLLTRCDTADASGHLAFNAQGSQLAVGSLSGAILMYRISGESLIPQPPLEGHRRPTTALSFDTSGRWLASASDDGELRFWDTQSGQPLGVMKNHEESFVRQIVAGPDAGEMITLSQGGRRISLWDIDPDRATALATGGRTK